MHQIRAATPEMEKAITLSVCSVCRANCSDENISDLKQTFSKAGLCDAVTISGVSGIRSCIQNNRQLLETNLEFR